MDEHICDGWEDDERTVPCRVCIEAAFSRAEYKRHRRQQLTKARRDDQRRQAEKASVPRTGVYFIHAPSVPGRVKIGYSDNVLMRLAHLQSGSPVEMELLGVARGGFELEAELHRRLAEHRLHGEWFTLDVRAARRLIWQVGGKWIDGEDPQIPSKDVATRDS